MRIIIAPTDVETWRAAIGRVETRSETLDVESLRRFAAAIGEQLDVERIQPSLAHWAFFLPVVANSEIGDDGHPKRGGFLPAVTLPRRMFASATMRFGRPLMLGCAATRTATIADVRHKPGRSGDLVFVEVDYVISQDGHTCVAEHQTVVYRQEGEPVPPVQPVPRPGIGGEQVWQPGPVDLFRFSAVTFNSHRIYYDAPYATQREGYPGLVVHGPFTAAKLYGYARGQAGKSVTEFSFRAVAPLFVGQPIGLIPGEASGTVTAMRCDGATAMTAAMGFAS